MTSELIHVRCGARGTWVVHLDGCESPISEYATENEAERAACEHAARRGDGQVVVHDRYERTHWPQLRPRESSAPPAHPRPAPDRARGA